MSRRHLINSSDVFVIKGFTVYRLEIHSVKMIISFQVLIKIQILKIEFLVGSPFMSKGLTNPGYGLIFVGDLTSNLAISKMLWWLLRRKNISKNKFIKVIKLAISKILWWFDRRKENSEKQIYKSYKIIKKNLYKFCPVCSDMEGVEVLMGKILVCLS